MPKPPCPIINDLSKLFVTTAISLKLTTENSKTSVGLPSPKPSGVLSHLGPTSSDFAVSDYCLLPKCHEHLFSCENIVELGMGIGAKINICLPLQ